jgi:hypothetical protein
MEICMRTEDYKSLNMITNCFLAAEQIRKVNRQPLNEGEYRSVIPGNEDALYQILSIIANYSPEKYKKPLTETISKVDVYRKSYKGLKRNISTMRDQGFNRNQFIEILSLMQPVLDTRKQNMINKILKLIELLDS